MNPMSEDYPLKSLSRIERSLSSPKSSLVGSSDALALGLLLSQQTSLLHKKPQLILVSDPRQALRVKQAIEFFNPKSESSILPAFDVSLYSGIYPKSSTIAQRLNWLFRAFNARPGQIFIACTEALCQKTLPTEIFIDNCSSLSANDELPSDFLKALAQLGYLSTPTVEDVGTFSSRGGLLDIYSPAHPYPIRLELFGDSIESLRSFDPETQRTIEPISTFHLIPAREILFQTEFRLKAGIKFKQSVDSRGLQSNESEHISQSLSRGKYFSGVDFLLPYFYDQLDSALNYFSSSLNIWNFNPTEISRAYDNFYDETKNGFKNSDQFLIKIDPDSIYDDYTKLEFPKGSHFIDYSKIEFAEENKVESISWDTRDLKEFKKSLSDVSSDENGKNNLLKQKLDLWKKNNFKIFITCPSTAQQQRLKLILEDMDYEPIVVEDNLSSWSEWVDQQDDDKNKIHLISRDIENSLYINQEELIFLKGSELLNKKTRKKTKTSSQKLFNEKAQALSFAELQPGDLIVHKLHGVGIYKGLQVMPINQIDAEFIELEYKNKDKLYIPIYRISQIQKYSGPTGNRLIDKLGGTSWNKSKTKVKKQLRDIASELLNLYAKRAKAQRAPFSSPDNDFISFENAFPFEETDDQLSAINDVLKDMTSSKPMDRLICGDVGFGKTEVAMRAAFKAAQDGKQVALIAPTTILTLQHFENFKKRFKDWPMDIRCLNRFVSPVQVKQNVADLKDGTADIVIGTHRLFSSDIQFKNLGLLIIDEEQKFGVRHKEKIRKFKADVDTLVLSATPIPRTLNMSFLGIRDLSLINTAPVDRLPTRTLICRREESILRKAILEETGRGGQIFYLHNKVQTIEAEADEIRKMVPEIRIGIGHGQMNEGELEKVMLKFYNHEIDLLICSTIIESGIDIPNANTMFINNAQHLGLSQLYQLRGRVGRSQRRAYCYLLIPPFKNIDGVAQERLRALQENTALGSGIRIAQYDLELRGAGNLLGENQAGHVQSVGYEMYMELLAEVMREQKGDSKPIAEIEPEINIRIPALIPSNYIADIRVRLSYYKILSNIKQPEDLDALEDEFKDLFGTPPPELINLMGVMLIRKECKDLGIKDCSGGKVGLSLSFTENTPVKINKILELTSQQSQKYKLNPDSKLIVRMKELSWPRVYEEINYLKRLC